MTLGGGTKVSSILDPELRGKTGVSVSSPRLLGRVRVRLNVRTLDRGHLRQCTANVR